MASYFVTGTDTGVGKTLVACGLLHAFAARGASTAGMKPVAAGCEGGRYEDVERLRDASTVGAPRALVNPYAFAPPIAPHIAAELEGVEIRIETIVAAHARLARMAQVVVVEGAGGFKIPLGPRETSAGLARALGAPVVLVVGMRLGCLNHALLSRDAVAAEGLRLAGWVANCIQPQMPQLERNIGSLEARLGCPLLGMIAHRPGIGAREAGARLRIDPLQ